MLRNLYKNYMWNQYNCGDKKRLFEKNKTKYHYWKPDEFDNFGDIISPYIFNSIGNSLGLELTDIGSSVVGIGSLIEKLPTGTIVWGSGCRNNDQPMLARSLDVRLCRGPLTAEKLEAKLGIKCSKYGDPALILPKILPRTKTTSSKRIYVPHFTKISMPTHDIEKKFGRVKTIYPITDYWPDILDEIWTSELVICGALHAKIVADAYGIPSVLCDATENLPFKYHDYLLSTNQKNVSYRECTNIDNDLLENIQENIISTFPIDQLS